MKKEQEIKEMDTNMKEMNLEEMEMADGGYIVDRGILDYYWVVNDTDGKVRATSFFKGPANHYADFYGVSREVISEAKYNEWMEQKKQK